MTKLNEIKCNCPDHDKHVIKNMEDMIKKFKSWMHQSIKKLTPIKHPSKKKESPLHNNCQSQPKFTS